MDFPTYVPAAVQTHITMLIEGDKRMRYGCAAMLANAEQVISKIEQTIEARTRCGEMDDLDSLRQKKMGAVRRRDTMAGNVECLKRLANDVRMKDAFALLTGELTNDTQWCAFISAAWAAQMDYKPYRERLRLAAELKEDIADVADKLAKLLRQFSKTGVYGPSEFYSVPELLRNTDNHELQEHNLMMWRMMRRHVVGDPIRRDVSGKEQIQDDRDSVSAPNIVIRWLEPNEKPNIDAAEVAGNTMQYGWGVAPDFSELLDTLVTAARAFKPSESGMIGAAINTRQANAKNEYLRAFGNLLTDVHHFTLTAPIMRAIAIVASVAMNLPDDNVAYADVQRVPT